MTYTLTLNPEVCHEVHVGRLTVPVEAAPVSEVSTGWCRPEIRVAGELELYVTAACAGPRATWFSAPEKYAVDLSGRRETRRISDVEWQAAAKLLWNEDRGIDPLPNDRGVQYKGPLLERSAPRWAGVGGGPPRSSLSANGKRAAVNCWDGFDIRYSFLDPSSVGKRNKITGKYWVDIYETSSGHPLVRIQGSFDGADPYIFQEGAVWFEDRYYVLPVGGTIGSGQFSLRRLLVCDVDAAARKGETVLKERK